MFSMFLCVTLYLCIATKHSTFLMIRHSLSTTVQSSYLFSNIIKAFFRACYTFWGIEELTLFNFEIFVSHFLLQAIWLFQGTWKMGDQFGLSVATKWLEFMLPKKDIDTMVCGIVIHSLPYFQTTCITIFLHFCTTSLRCTALRFHDFVGDSRHTNNVGSP